MENMKITKKEILVSFLVLTLTTSNLTSSANAAAKPAPKVGNCYNLTKAQVSVDYSDVAPVNCLKTHSAETYRIVKLKSTDLASDYDLAKATTVCQPWKGTSKFFNYWAWYIPNPEQQSAGQNWIRCDAMTVKDYNESTGDYIVTSWKGKRLDVR
jgi:hypothetical protein